MAPDPSTVTDPDEQDIVEWGDAEDGSARTGRFDWFWQRWSTVDNLTDRQLLIGLVGVAGAFVLASLFADWAVVTPPAVRDGPNRTVLAGAVHQSVGDIGAWGAVYLFGILGLAVLAAFALFAGSTSARAHARLAGLATGGGLLAVLVAAATNLDRSDVTLSYLLALGSVDADLSVAYGSGLFLALAGIAAGTTAMYFSDRPIRRRGLIDDEVYADDLVDAEDVDEVVAVEVVEPELEVEIEDPHPAPRPRVPSAPRPSSLHREPRAPRLPGWTRRPAPRERVREPELYDTPGPVDLTVRAALPFIHLPEKPSTTLPEKPDGR